MDAHEPEGEVKRLLRDGVWTGIALIASLALVVAIAGLTVGWALERAWQRVTTT